MADELRKLHPDLEIEWLAQSPVTTVLHRPGERIHAASAHMRARHPASTASRGEHDLHCFQAWRRMDEIMVANFVLFHEIVRDGDYDLWIGGRGMEGRLLSAREP